MEKRLIGLMHEASTVPAHLSRDNCTVVIVLMVTLIYGTIVHKYQNS